LVPAAARAEKILVLPASGAGVSAPYIQSARALFVTRLSQQNGRLQIIDMERPPTPEPPLPAQALALAIAVKAEGVVLLDMRRTNETTSFKVTGLAVPQGHRLFFFEQSTLAGPEAMPTMVESAIAAVVMGYGRETPEVWSRALPSTSPGPDNLSLGFRAGTRIPRDTPGETTLALWAAGLFVKAQFTRMLVDLGFDYAGAENGSSTRFGVGAYLPFSRQPTTPYLGASLRYQWSQFGGQGANGFVVTPTLGMVWRRKDSLGLSIEGGAFYDLYSEKEIDRLIPGNSTLHRSYGFELWVGTWL
jgi:hypothetical protein